MASKLHKPDPYKIDDENPEWTDEMFARAKPAKEFFPPDVYAALVAEGEERRARRRATKQQITLRLDGDILDHFKRGGRFWQRRINEALRAAMAAEDKAAK